MTLKEICKHNRLKEIIFKPLFVILILLALGSCATQNKYGKHKPMPCPCETNFRR
jgi:hypothetical protein